MASETSCNFSPSPHSCHHIHFSAFFLQNYKSPSSVEFYRFNSCCSAWKIEQHAFWLPYHLAYCHTVVYLDFYKRVKFFIKFLILRVRLARPLCTYAPWAAEQSNQPYIKVLLLCYYPPSLHILVQWSKKFSFMNLNCNVFRTVLLYKTIYWQEYYLANLIVKSNWWILYWRFKLPCLPSRVSYP